MTSKDVIVLGSTGSIGTSTLDVIRTHKDIFNIVALSAHTNKNLLEKQAKEFDVDILALSGAEDGSVSYSGEEGLLRLIDETDADIVVNGVAGAKGLLPSKHILERGMDLALANKETMVMAGKLVRELSEKTGSKLLPVDSEHSAVFYLDKGFRTFGIKEIILTASGGAFRDTPEQKLEHVTIEDALSHPTWNMGKKITIDSATMANKGLEVIEANELFDISCSNIKVRIHPESCVHSLIRTKENSLYAQISSPDMRIPIQNALTYPELLESPFGKLDLDDFSLNFSKPDMKKYPLLSLAYRAADSGGCYPLAYNAANEVAVEAFIEGGIRYLDIHKVVSNTLEWNWNYLVRSFQDVLENDKEARRIASEIVQNISQG